MDIKEATLTRDFFFYQFNVILQLGRFFSIVKTNFTLKHLLKWRTA